MGELSGKVAIITAASSGVGHAAALAFAAAGAAVVVTARREAALAALVDIIRAGGGQASVVAGTLGRMGPLGQMTREDWCATLETNSTGAFLAAKHQAEAMAASRGGAIVFTSTFVGHTLGFPGMAAYAASKAGMVGLMRVLAVEYAGREVRANAILSGGVDTPMGRSVTGSPEALAFVEGLHALKRVAVPAEIARAALFLASDAASFITWAAIPVDGGITVTRT